MSNKELYEELKNQGWEIRFRHKREKNILRRLDQRPTLGVVWFFKGLNPRGGRTECEIVNHKTHVASRGIARCNKTDAFNKKYGARLALERALRALPEDLAPHGVQFILS